MFADELIVFLDCTKTNFRGGDEGENRAVSHQTFCPPQSPLPHQLEVWWESAELQLNMCSFSTLINSGDLERVSQDLLSVNSDLNHTADTV